MASRGPLPWWSFVIVILFSVAMMTITAPFLWEIVIVPWQALSATLSVAPLIAMCAYLCECKKTRKKATFRGYWEAICVVRRAKRVAYEETSKRLLPGDAPRIAVAVLFWMLIVFTAVAGSWSTVMGLVRCLLGK